MMAKVRISEHKNKEKSEKLFIALPSGSIYDRHEIRISGRGFAGQLRNNCGAVL